MEEMIKVFKDNNYDEIKNYFCFDKYEWRLDDKDMIFYENINDILNVCSKSIKYFIKAYLKKDDSNILNKYISKSLNEDPKNYLAYKLLLSYNGDDNLIIKYFDIEFSDLFDDPWNNLEKHKIIFQDYIKIKKEYQELKLKFEFSDLSQLEKEFNNI